MEISLKTTNSDWKKLWPDCVAGRDFEGFEEPIVSAIVALGHSMGLEVNEEDMKELVEDHSKELTTEELQHLYKMQQEKAAVKIFQQRKRELVVTFPVLKLKNCASIGLENRPLLKSVTLLKQWLTGTLTCSVTM